MKERVGRVDEIKGETVKGKSDLQNRYPGGKMMKPYKTQTWLEEETAYSSNHSDQAPQEILSTSKTGIESSTLLGSMLLRMIVTRGDEEHSSSG